MGKYDRQRRTAKINKEWLNEPDRLEFTYKSFPCLIRRNGMGSLCGYVGMSEDHPYYGIESNDERLSLIDIHGGITFSRKGNGEDWNKDYWWIGFDMAHSEDIQPVFLDPEKNSRLYRYLYHQTPKPTYKNIEYVKKEIRRLVRQLTLPSIAARELEIGVDGQRS